MTSPANHGNGHAGAAAGAQAAAPLYQLRGVSRIYGSGSGRVAALEDVELDIRAGELLAVVGASGSGKTTLLQLLGALDRPTSGSIAFAGNPLAGVSERGLTVLRRTRIGFVFQQFNLIPTLTARQNVEAKLVLAAGGSRAHRAGELLDAVGLGGRAHHLPSQLSGGEQQRVAIARALSTSPSVVLADEPTGNLDTTTGREILDLLRTLSAEHGQTVVLVTHDRELAESAPRLIELRDGRVVADHAGSERGQSAPAPA
jgi:ABC-type lipoprotein export system ATPase subunit